MKRDMERKVFAEVEIERRKQESKQDLIVKLKSRRKTLKLPPRGNTEEQEDSASQATLAPLTKTDLDEIEAEMESRRRTMREACVRNGLDTADAEGKLKHKARLRFA
jgi:hypothetical protein